MEKPFDVWYRPLSDGVAWVAEGKLSSIFFLGKGTASAIIDLNRVEADRRELLELDPETKRTLRDGAYVFEKAGQRHAVIVSSCSPPASAAADHQVDSTNHLGEVAFIWRSLWDRGEALGLIKPIQEETLVRPKSQDRFGTIKRVIRIESGFQYEVDIDGRLLTFDSEDLDIVEGDPRSPESWLKQAPADSLSTQLLLSFLKLDRPLSNTIYSFQSSRTVFRPYQFIPVLKMIGSTKRRLLIADEVGLGKTIEAGLIWTELDLRDRIRRALVVVPASLKAKWRLEMKSKFDRELDDLDLNAMRAFIQSVKDGQDRDLQGVISIETLRRDQDLLTEMLELRVQFDFVIVDEAHVMRNRGKNSHRVGEVLSELADNLIFLSATPLNLKQADLFNLLTLLDEEAFPSEEVFPDQVAPNEYLNAIAREISVNQPGTQTKLRTLLERVLETDYGRALELRPDFHSLKQLISSKSDYDAADVARVHRLCAELGTLGAVLSRTRKVDVPEAKAIRKVEEVEVAWTSEERALYDAVYADAMARALRSNLPLGFLLQMPLRQACSSLPVMQAKIALREGWQTEDEVIFSEIETKANALEGAEAFAAANDLILRQKINYDSKLEALRARLLEARAAGHKQVLIFSFFRGTVEYLARELSKDFSTGVLHGGIRVDDREDVISSFRRNEFEILIANQVGSEGLDFQFCNVLVNYDLPWNPMQVEQRIGRLDRFGQQSEKIFIINMKTPGTIETDIFLRLYDRIEVFKNSIGDLEPIMRSTFDELEAQFFSPELSLSERQAKADQYAVQVQKEAARIQEVEKNSKALSSVAYLEIAGITESGPTSGRYIGVPELLSLLDEVLVNHGVDKRPVRDGDSLTFRVNKSLGAALNDLAGTQQRNSSSIRRLLGECFAEVEVEVSLDARTAELRGSDLLSSTYPLISLAIAERRATRHRLVRFGRLGLEGYAGRKFVASVDFIESTGGLLETRELWVTAVDAFSGEIVAELDEQIKVALVQGKLHESQLAPPINIEALYARAATLVSDRHAIVRETMQADNLALVRARTLSYEDSVRRKLERYTRNIEEAEAAMTANKRSILPAWEANRRQLEAQLEAASARFEKQANLTLSREPVAVLLIEGV